MLPTPSSSSKDLKVAQPIVLPAPFKGRLCFFVEDVFSKEECDAMILRTENIGYDVAQVNVGDREILARDYRRSSRCIIDDFELSTEIFSRIEHLLPKIFKNDKLIRLNERLRFLRYDEGDFFQPHFDGSYVTPDGKQVTKITIQLYLNEGFEGGETTFISSIDERVRVPYVPKTGSILIFEHRILHEGSLLKKGRKYTMRSDVLYTNEPSI